MNVSCATFVAGLLSAVPLLGTAFADEAIDTNLVVAIQHSNQDVILSWFASNNVLYRVESSSNFVWGNASPVLNGLGTPLLFTNLASTPHSFFRIKRYPDITAAYNPSSSNLTVLGNELDNVITVGRDGAGHLLVNNGSIPITGGIATVTNTLLIEVFARAGNDQLTIDSTGGLMPSAHLYGEEDADTLMGSSANDRLEGGPGQDMLIGRGGSDLLIGGEQDDTFAWNPGDGSDTIEGEGGTDTLLFNGSNGSEIIDLSTNGTRLRLFRNVGNIVMDVNGVEQVTVNALGGSDFITVNSLAGTGVNLVNLDLAGAGNTDDTVVDVVTLVATAGADTFNFSTNAGALEASGFGTTVRVFDAANTTDLVSLSGVGNDQVNINGSSGPDTMTVTTNGGAAVASCTGYPLPVSVSGQLTLKVNGLGGADLISCLGNPSAIVPLVLDGGDGDDTLLGGTGPEVIYGGQGEDFIDGNQGNDTLFGGSDNDTFNWDPGDASDTIEGEGGTDTLLFNGSNSSEVFNLLTNGSRFQLQRNVGNIVMDVNGVEQVTINALGGTDSITVNSLSGTGISSVNIELASTGGTTGDSQADTVFVNGTSAGDDFSLSAFAGVVSVTGLSVPIQIGHPEVSLDTLTLNGLDGTDTFNVGPGVTALIMVVTNQ